MTTSAATKRPPNMMSDVETPVVKKRSTEKSNTLNDIERGSTSEPLDQMMAAPSSVREIEAAEVPVGVRRGTRERKALKF
jgi:hypothetical protein